MCYTVMGYTELMIIIPDEEYTLHGILPQVCECVSKWVNVKCCNVF